MNFSGKLSFRPAMVADRRSVWDWRKEHADLGLVAVNGELTYERFCDWFESVLADPSSLLIVGHVESVRLGLAWLARRGEGNWRMSVSLKPAYCGRGITAAFLAGAARHAAGIVTIDAVEVSVSRLNPHSATALVEAGYVVTETETAIVGRLAPGGTR